VKKQLTLVGNEFERFRKPTRREKFLTEMNTVVPWVELVAVVEPYYPKTTRKLPLPVDSGSWTFLAGELGPVLRQFKARNRCLRRPP